MPGTNLFAEELEQLEIGLQQREKQLSELPPNTPHPTCPCGRSLNEHLQDEIECLEALYFLFVDNNKTPLNLLIQNNGNQIINFAVAQIWRYSSDLVQVREERGMNTLQKISDFLKAEVERAVMPDEVYRPGGPGATEKNGYGHWN